MKSTEANATIKQAMWANGILGFVGMFIGISTANDAVIADAMHNLSDAGAHKAHDLTERSSKNNDHKVKLYSRLAAVAIAAGALLVGANSINNILDTQTEETLDYATVGIEAAAITTNLVLSRKYKNDKDTALGHQHSMDHNKRDLLTSMGALCGVMLEPVVPAADSIAGIVISGAMLQYAYSIQKNELHNH